jgi:NYN domain/OST-HTH/LOTUS domain
MDVGGTSGRPEARVNIAVFWDFENVDHVPGGVDIGGVMAWIRSHGRVIINEAFGDFSRRLARYERVLLANQMHVVPVLPRRKHLHDPVERKGLADLVLAMNVVERVLTTPSLSTVVIVSGDADFVELALWCRSRGLSVIGIATGRVHPAWRGACDEFVRYDTIVSPTAGVQGIETPSAQRPVVDSLNGSGPKGASRPGVSPSAASPAGSSPHGTAPPGTAPHRMSPTGVSPTVSDDVRQLVHDAVVGPMRDSGRQQLQIGTFKSWLRSTNPDFDERQLGATSIAEFVSWFEEWFELVPGEGGQYVSLRSNQTNGRSLPPPSGPPSPAFPHMAFPPAATA